MPYNATSPAVRKLAAFIKAASSKIALTPLAPDQAAAGMPADPMGGGGAPMPMDPGMDPMAMGGAPMPMDPSAMPMDPSMMGGAPMPMDPGMDPSMMGAAPGDLAAAGAPSDPLAQIMGKLDEISRMLHIVLGIAIKDGKANLKDVGLDKEPTGSPAIAAPAVAAQG